MEKKRIALVSFDALIPNYQEVQEWVAFLRRQEGSRVTLLSCEAALSRCTNSISLPKLVRPEEVQKFRSENCPGCILKQQNIPADASYRVDRRHDDLSPEQLAFKQSLAASLSAQGSLAGLMHVAYAELSIVRHAFFDFCIARKISPTTRLTPGDQEVFIQIVEDLLIVMNFCRRISGKEAFDEIVYTNGNYTLNSWIRAVWPPGPTFVSIEHVFSCQTFWNRIFFQKNRLALESTWPAVEDSLGAFPAEREAARRALDVFDQRFSGNDFNSYVGFDSRAAKKIEFDAFRAGHPTLYSLFLSSGDELEAHILTHGFDPDSSIFRSQLEMLQGIHRDLNDQIGLVIRIHPRLAPNKRSEASSGELEGLEGALGALAARKNVFILYPEDKVSSYYVMLRSDLILITWSTIGLESLVAGVPCISFFPGNCMYPLPSLCNQPAKKADFEEVLRGSVPASTYQVDSNAVLSWVSHVYWSSTVGVPSPRRQNPKFWLCDRAFRYAVHLPLFSRCVWAIFSLVKGKKTIGLMRAAAAHEGPGQKPVFEKNDPQLMAELARWRAAVRARFGVA